jgi:hypothetical protein
MGIYNVWFFLCGFEARRGKDAGRPGFSFVTLYEYMINVEVMFLDAIHKVYCTKPESSRMSRVPVPERK